MKYLTPLPPRASVSYGAVAPPPTACVYGIKSLYAPPTPHTLLPGNCRVCVYIIALGVSRIIHALRHQRRPSARPSCIRFLPIPPSPAVALFLRAARRRNKITPRHGKQPLRYILLYVVRITLIRRYYFLSCFAGTSRSRRRTHNRYRGRRRTWPAQEAASPSATAVERSVAVRR